VDCPTFPGIRPSGSNRKKCRYDGLDDQSQVHRSIKSTDEIMPRSPEYLFHGTTALSYWRNPFMSLTTSMKANTRSVKWMARADERLLKDAASRICWACPKLLEQ
jgi:hypothetical protein